MPLKQLLGGDSSRSATIYLAIGGLSLLKAIAVRNDRERFRRELIDAGFYLGIGLVLRQYSRLKAEKQAELQSQLPDWIAGEPAQEPSGKLRSIVN